MGSGPDPKDRSLKRPDFGRRAVPPNHPAANPPNFSSLSNFPSNVSNLPAVSSDIPARPVDRPAFSSNFPRFDGFGPIWSVWLHGLEVAPACLRSGPAAASSTIRRVSFRLRLILTQDLSFNARKPARGQRYGLRCVCPIMAADIVVSKYRRQGLPEGVIGFEGPAAPVLMAPQLVELARSKGRSVRLHAYNAMLVFGDTGFRFDGEGFGHFPMIDVAASEPVGVEFIPAVEFPAPPQLKTVKMSNVRVQMDQIHKLKRRAMAI